MNNSVTYYIPFMLIQFILFNLMNILFEYSNKIYYLLL